MTNENQTNYDSGNYEEYFTTFSSKEEYLVKRTEWRDLYQRLSEDIRHNKHVHKEHCRAFSKVVRILDIEGKYWYRLTDLKRKQYHEELAKERSKIPNKRIALTHWYDPTELLKVRHEMKELSRQQREESLKSLI